MAGQSSKQAQHEVTGEEQLPPKYMTRSAGKQKAKEEDRYIFRSIVVSTPVIFLEPSAWAILLQRYIHLTKLCTSMPHLGKHRLTIELMYVGDNMQPVLVRKEHN